MSARGGRQDVGAGRDRQLAAHVGPSEACGLPGKTERASHAPLAVASRALAELALLACLVAGTWGLVCLVLGIVPLSYATPPAVLAAVLPSALVMGAHLVASRVRLPRPARASRSLPWVVRHLVGLVVLACLVGLIAIAIAERDALAPQLTVAADALAQGPAGATGGAGTSVIDTIAGQGSPSSDPGSLGAAVGLDAVAGDGDLDATLLVALGSALVATVLSLFTFVLSAGWLLGLATLPLLGAYPDLGLVPDVSLVCLVALPLVGLVAHDLALQRRGRAGAALLVALMCAALCLLVGGVIARGQFAQLSRAPEAVNTWGTELYEAIRSGELTSGGRARDGAGTSGTGGTAEEAHEGADGAQGDQDAAGATPYDDAPLDTPADASAGATAEEQGTGAAAEGQTGPGTDATPSDAGDAGDASAQGVVSRGDLHQDGLPLLEVTLDQQPTSTLYLRQFTGASYANGAWDSAGELEDAFALQEATARGLGADEVASALANDAFEQALAWGVGGGTVTHATLRGLADTLDVTTLAPYVVAPNQAGGSGLDSSAATEGSSMVAFEFADLGTYADLTASGALDATGAVVGGDTNANAGGTDEGDPLLAGLGADYDEWATSTYLVVGTDALPRLAQLVADNPQTSLAEITAFIMRTLAEGATYTTTPGAFPTDVDIAEYLLFDGHRGYCQHFATAATLMYRLYGVPARYVTGYAIPASAFSETAGGTWHAVASDVRAHAWVEVYVEGLGWVPVEVTPAGSTQAAPWTDDPANAAGADGQSASMGEAGSAGGEATGDEVAGDAGADADTGEAGAAGSAGQNGGAAAGEAEPLAGAGSVPGDAGDASTGAAGAPAAIAVSQQGASATQDGSFSSSLEAGDPLSTTDGADSSGVPGNPSAPKASSELADAQNDEGTSPEAEPADDQGSPAMRLLIVLGGAIALVGVIVAGTRLVSARRRRIVSARRQAPPDALLAEMLDALSYADIARGLTGTEPDAARRLSEAVPALSLADAEHFVEAALRAAFGPTDGSRFASPADERCLAAYDRAVDHAYGTLPRRRQLAFTFGHAWR